MWKFVTELKGVVSKAGVSAIFLNVIPEVGNTVAAPIPTFAIASVFICALSQLFWINTDFHSKIEQWIWFCKIIYIELHSHSFECIFNLEKEPLSMTVGVNVVLHKQVVLQVWNFLSKIQVAGLKFWFKK